MAARSLVFPDRTTAWAGAALSQLAPRIKWVESYVTQDKTFCVYLAEDEAVIHDHARISGFPANKVTEVSAMIGPATANGGARKP